MATTPTPTPPTVTADQLPNPPAPAAPDPVTQLRADFDAALRAQQAETERLKAALVQAQRPQQQPGQQPSIEDLNREFYQNPVGNTAQIAQHVAGQTMAAVQAQMLPNLIRTARSEARSKNPALFDKYAAEIDQAMEQIQPGGRANPAIWEQAYRMTLGSHMEELTAEARTTGGAQPTRRHDGPEPPSTRPAPVQRPAELSPEEKRVAQKFGISDDDYRAARDQFEPMGNGGFATKDDAFDEALVLDSRKWQRGQGGRWQRRTA